MDLVDRFLEGFRATVFSPNAMTCSSKVRVTADAFNNTIMGYFTPSQPGYQWYVFNFTKTLSSSGADAFGECYTSGFNVVQYILMRAGEFPDFVTMMTAFLQNLIGNILNFNTIYQNIVTANTAGKLSDVYFYIGRLTYLIVYFDPMSDAPAPAKLEQTPVPQPLEFFLYQGLYNGPQIPSSIFTIIYDLPVSFLNSSVGISSPNSTLCLGNLTVLNSSLNMLLLQFNLSLYDKMGGTLKTMIQEVNPISQACYYSGFEYFQILLDYLATITDVNKLVYNVFHNAGTIYDATSDLIDNFRFDTPNYRSYWQRIGGDIGLIVNQISYKPNGYNEGS